MSTGKLKNGTEERYTAVFNSSNLNDLKNIAYWSRLKIKDPLNTAIADFIATWKADPKNKAHIKAGKILQRPKDEE